MAIGTYFDTKRDNQLIASGSHFWCETCLMARPLTDQSLDPRYCQGCYEFLLKEAEIQARMLPRIPTTIPQTTKEAVISPRMVKKHLPTIPKAKKARKQASPQNIKATNALQSKSRRVKAKSRPKVQPVLQGSLF